MISAASATVAAALSALTPCAFVRRLRRSVERIFQLTPCVGKLILRPAAGPPRVCARRPRL